MQGLEAEGGGFRGRTNKLVDGCYSWWVGGLFPLLDDIMGEPLALKGAVEETMSFVPSNEQNDEWADHDGVLLSCQLLFRH